VNLTVIFHEGINAMTPLTPALRHLFDAIADDAVMRTRPDYLQEPWEPYCCFGCLQANFPNPGKKLLQPDIITRKLTAAERSLVLGLLLVPQTRAALAQELGFWLTPWAYFPQAYEEGVQGPGAVLGLSHTEPKISLAQGLQFWLWQSKATYLAVSAMGDEAKIAERLWTEAQHQCGAGLNWLARKQNYAQVDLTQEIRDEVHTLLGVPPLQQLVSQRLNRNWQLTSLETIEVRG
jgi:hypothetical protein